MYENNQSCVSLNSRHTDMFSVNIGVKVFLISLFSLYIHDLAQEINDLQCGIDIDGTMLSELENLVV